jgi:DNA repair protein RecO
MSRARERIVEGFVLKKQDYGEADQIVTIFSKEEGKLRALIKAAKLPTSKLQPLLQPLFQTRINLTGSNSGTGLAKVIGVQLVKAYSGIYESEAKLASWYVAAEVIIRALPDNAPNEKLFSEFQNYAQFLHETDFEPELIKHSVIQFQIKAMDALGLGIKSVEIADSEKVSFSLDRGGFVNDESADSVHIGKPAYGAFKKLKSGSYDTGKEILETEYKLLNNLVTRFVSYQLEREIKSQRMLSST